MAFVRRHACAGCGKRASAELVDRWNGSRGFYCGACLKTALRDQLLNEGKTGAELREAVREGLRG